MRHQGSLQGRLIVDQMPSFAQKKSRLGGSSNSHRQAGETAVAGRARLRMQQTSEQACRCNYLFHSLSQLNKSYIKFHRLYRGVNHSPPEIRFNLRLVCQPAADVM